MSDSKRPQAIVTAWILETVDAEILIEHSPEWMRGIGKSTFGTMAPMFAEMYESLTGLPLPDEPTSRDRRRLDILLRYSDGTAQVFEVDERQHFNPERAKTFEHYPIDALLGFPLEDWKFRSQTSRAPMGGGWARPCPPLFPDVGGRHKQRAFRDAIADLLPSLHGFRPTLRISDTEVKLIQKRGELAQSTFARTMVSRGLPEAYLR